MSRVGVPLLLATVTPTMVHFPSLDRYDFAAAAAAACLLFVGYVVYPTRIVKVAVWLTIFTIYVCWMAFFVWKWVYDVEV